MSTSPTRRHLVFEMMPDISREAQELLERGYQPAGQWNLAQICEHLSEWLRFPIDGFPPVPVLLRPLLWIARQTIAQGQLKKILKEKKFPPGRPTLPCTVFAPNRESDAQAVAKLTATVERFRTYLGPLHPSPLFGRLDREVYTRLQLVHAAHHLGYLIPRT